MYPFATKYFNKYEKMECMLQSAFSSTIFSDTAAKLRLNDNKIGEITEPVWESEKIDPNFRASDYGYDSSSDCSCTDAS